MSHEWKPGDRAMVTVTATGVMYANLEGAGDWRVPYSALSPVPPSLTPEAQAVIDASNVPHDRGSLKWWSKLDDALDAYRASLAPPDPVAEVIAAWRECSHRKPVEASPRLVRAIAALEASRKP